MNAHWSQTFVEFIRSVIPEINVPIYILRNDESGGEWQAEWMACFSPLSDLRSQGRLEQLGLWAGRGVAITVRNDFATWSNRCQWGTLLHEAAHALEYLSQPEALCPAADLSPIAREVLTGSESELLAEVGLHRNDLIAEQHGAEFVRLCMHLHKRAWRMVILSPADLQFLHGAYSLGSERFEAVSEALSSELARSHNLNLLRLSESPEAFQRLFS